MIMLYKHTGNRGTERNFLVLVPFRQKPENGNGTEQPPLGGVPSSLEDARNFDAASALLTGTLLGAILAPLLGTFVDLFAPFTGGFFCVCPLGRVLCIDCPRGAHILTGGRYG